MHPDKWKEIKQRVLSSFSDAEEFSEDLEPGSAEVLEFSSPVGKLQVKYITKPKVLDKKTTFSKRAGSEVKVDYVFSDDEVVNYMEILKYNDQTDSWEKIDQSLLNL